MFKCKVHNKVFNVLWFILAVFMISCNRPVLKVTDIPANTPENASIFVSGNFNRWDPGDQRFTLTSGTDSAYYITLPKGFGKMQFKFTRGDWQSVESDVCGYTINNREHEYSGADTIEIRIESWIDMEALNCPKVTIVLDKLPENTPESDPIAIAGNFNEWSPDSNYFMQRIEESGKYVLTLPRLGTDRQIEYKITRGNLLKAEADMFGNEINKRTLFFGDSDTIYLEVENWEDFDEKHRGDFVTIILDRIPQETPQDDNIYITGNFNGWYPRDKKYILQRNSTGQYQIELPKEHDIIEFKFTRGDWSTEEVNISGHKISNRSFSFGKEDTLYVNIFNWLDMAEERPIDVIMIIDKVPTRTPTDDDLYMASSFNWWDARNRKHRFSRMADGKYFLTLKRADPQFQYKITRGDWDTEEVNEFGLPSGNRDFEYSGDDTIHIGVLNWLDLPEMEQDQVVIMLKVPDYLPSGEKVYITGTFNDWNPGDPNFIMNRNLKGEYYIGIPKRADEIQFKFTLGSWEREELNEFWNTIDNRNFRFGYADTLNLQADNFEGF